MTLIIMKADDDDDNDDTSDDDEDVSNKCHDFETLIITRVVINIIGNARYSFHIQLLAIENKRYQEVPTGYWSLATSI